MAHGGSRLVPVRSRNQITLGKGSDTFAPIRPKIVPVYEAGDWSKPRVSSPLNGEAMQDAPMAGMLLPLLAFATALVTLEPGDVVTTGTPAGVGYFQSACLPLGRRRDSRLRPWGRRCHEHGRRGLVSRGTDLAVGSSHELAPLVGMSPLCGDGAMLNMVDSEARPFVREHSHEQLGLVIKCELWLRMGAVDQHLEPGHEDQVAGGVGHAAWTLDMRCRVVDAFQPVRQDYRQHVRGRGCSESG